MGAVRVETAASSPSVPGFTCLWLHRVGCCKSLLSFVQLEHGVDREESTCPGPLWRRTQRMWPGRRRHNCGWGENPGRETELEQQPALIYTRAQEAACSPTVSPRQKCAFTDPGEGSGCRNNKLSGQNVIQHHRQWRWQVSVGGPCCLPGLLPPHPAQQHSLSDQGLHVSEP